VTAQELWAWPLRPTAEARLDQALSEAPSSRRAELSERVAEAKRTMRQISLTRPGEAGSAWYPIVFLDGAAFHVCDVDGQRIPWAGADEARSAAEHAVAQRFADTGTPAPVTLQPKA